jgi:hypothetical protein
MNKDTGGPAFPALEFQRPLKAGESVYESSGMTLRDYFAAHAMQETDWINLAASAKECYEIADAMLKAREQ